MSRTPVVPVVLLVLGLAVAPPAAALAGDAGTVSAPAEVAPPATPEIDVAVGRQTVLDVRGVTRVSIGDPSVADVTVVGTHEVLVTGMGEGKTSLIVWFHHGRHQRWQVVVRSPSRLAEAQATLRVLGLARVLTVEAAGRHLVVEGTLETLDQLRRFDQLKGAEPGLVSLVKVDPAIYQRLADQITAALHEAGLANAHATALGTTIFLEGTVSDPSEAKQAADIAQAIWGQIRTGRLETR